MIPNSLHYAFVAAVLSLGSAAAATRPNILWLVAEDISPFFGCYGDPDASTPHLDEFARRSHLFLRAYATAPICAPSRSALGMGLYATSVGTQHLRSEVLVPATIRPLARVLREHGYWTALRGKTDYNFDARGLFDSTRDSVTPWEQRPAGKPFFAFVNLGATHEGPGNSATRAATALARLPAGRARDPGKVRLPPYFPDTPELRRIWARYHDLISVWDGEVKGVLDRLAAAGLAEDTIVFVMSDHGLGLPRYKRWLYQTGLQVPLIVHVPDKFRHLAPGGKAAGRYDRPVSLIDLPPTVLALAGIPIPENYAGKPLWTGGGAALRQESAPLIFGARDRADDMYDLSRSVFDGRHLYVRHFQPHLPPMQEGLILGPEPKESLRELHRVHRAGADTPVSARLWAPRPFEELYDLQEDPRELRNLAAEPAQSAVKARLAAELRRWMTETRDTGLLPEPELHRRAWAAGLTPFEMAQTDRLFPLTEILAAAEAASRGERPEGAAWAHADPALRWWALQAAIIRGDRDAETRERFLLALKDPNPTVRATAAEGLARSGETAPALAAFRELLRETEPNLGLFVARSVAVALADVRPIEGEIRARRAALLAPPGSPRPWKDFTYAAFTCWALEWALIKSGLNRPEDFAR